MEGVGTWVNGVFSLCFYYCNCVDGVLVRKRFLWELASYLHRRKPTGCKDFFCAPTHLVKVFLSTQSGALATVTRALTATAPTQFISFQELGGQLKMLAKNSINLVTNCLLTVG